MCKDLMWLNFTFNMGMEKFSGQKVRANYLIQL